MGIPQTASTLPPTISVQILVCKEDCQLKAIMEGLCAKWGRTIGPMEPVKNEGHQSKRVSRSRARVRVFADTPANAIPPVHRQSLSNQQQPASIKMETERLAFTGQLVARRVHHVDHPLKT